MGWLAQEYEIGAVRWNYDDLPKIRRLSLQDVIALSQTGNCEEETLDNTEDQSDGMMDLLGNALSRFFFDLPVWRFLGNAIDPPFFYLTKYLISSEQHAYRKELARESEFGDDRVKEYCYVEWEEDEDGTVDDM